MFVGCVVHDEIDQYAKPPFSRFMDKSPKFVECPKPRIHAEIVGDVIAVVAIGRGKKRQEPEAGHAEIGHIVQTAHQARGNRRFHRYWNLEMSQCRHVETIENSVLVPESLVTLVHSFRRLFMWVTDECPARCKLAMASAIVLRRRAVADRKKAPLSFESGAFPNLQFLHCSHSVSAMCSQRFHRKLLCVHHTLCDERFIQEGSLGVTG